MFFLDKGSGADVGLFDKGVNKFHKFIFVGVIIKTGRRHAPAWPKAAIRDKACSFKLPTTLNKVSNSRRLSASPGEVPARP